MKKGGKRRLEGSSDLGRQIRESRAERNLSQFDLAKLVGVSPTHISTIETGKVTNPGIELVERIADALGIRILLGTSSEDGRSLGTLAYESPFNLESSSSTSIASALAEIQSLLEDPTLPDEKRAELSKQLLAYAKWQHDELRKGEGYRD